MAGLGDEDLVLDADADAAVPLRRVLLQYRDRWDINPGLDRYDLRTWTSHHHRSTALHTERDFAQNNYTTSITTPAITWNSAAAPNERLWNRSIFAEYG